MSYFLDTSALNKIYHAEAGSEVIWQLYDGEGELVISELSLVEFESTAMRKARMGEITVDTLETVRVKFHTDLFFRYEVLDRLVRSGQGS